MKIQVGSFPHELSDPYKPSIGPVKAVAGRRLAKDTWQKGFQPAVVADAYGSPREKTAERAVAKGG